MRLLPLILLGLASATSAAATTVVADNPVLTLLGTFAAGTYRVSTPGTVDLAGGGEFVVDANGKPATKITSPGYGYCNPNGCETDVLSGGANGLAGPGSTSARSPGRSTAG